jgi:toxin ParE1/3/4
MAYRVELTARAVRDLRHIYRAISAVESEQARNWFNGLEAAVFSLEEFPTRCPVTPEESTLRHCLYGHKPYTYRIIYEIDEPKQLVRVMFIRHGARQPLQAPSTEHRAPST